MNHKNENPECVSIRMCVCVETNITLDWSYDDFILFRANFQVLCIFFPVSTRGKALDTPYARVYLNCELMIKKKCSNSVRRNV